MLDSCSIKKLQNLLLDWFQLNQRPLPWRINYQPYEVWISEIMLQQTQVKTVLPYYDSWMNTLPNIASVAEIEEDELLKLWEGLGYYSRARNAQKTSLLICDTYKGVFPRQYHLILDLPGIGAYTAGAICSIAYNQNQPAVDGNVIRVISRINALTQPVSENHKKIWEIANAWIPDKKARWFNQALMELGASLCQPKKPSCLLCPIQTFCEGFKNGSAESLPIKIKRPKPQPIIWTVALIQKNNKWLIRKRPNKGLMAGLWEFPSVQGDNLEENEAQLKVWMKTSFGLEIKLGSEICHFSHRYTNFLASVSCFESTLIEEEALKNENNTWKTLEDIKKLPMPTIQKKIINSLENDVS